MSHGATARTINRILPHFGIYPNRGDRVSGTIAKWMAFLSAGDDRGCGVPVRLCARDVFAAERLGVVETFVSSGLTGHPARFRLTALGRDVIRAA